MRSRVKIINTRACVCYNRLVAHCLQYGFTSTLLYTYLLPFLDRYAPLLGAMMSGSGAEYAHLKNSILDFPTVSEWIELMAEAGELNNSHNILKPSLLFLRE